MTAPLGAGWDRDRSTSGSGTTARSRYALDDAAHRARVGADPRDRVHRHRVRRVLPPLSGDDRSEIAAADAARGARAAPGHGSATQIDPCTCGRCRTSRCSAARCSRARACSTATQDVADMATVSRLLGAGRARVPLRRRHAPGVGCRRRRDPVPRRTSTTSSSDCRPVAGRRRRARDGAPQRAASRRICSCSGSTPAPATRTPVRTASPTAATLLLRSFNRLGVVALPVERARCRPTCRTPTSSPRSCSTTRRPARHRLRDVGDRSRRTTSRTSSSSDCSTSPTGSLHADRRRRRRRARRSRRSRRSARCTA